jgi:hypothetical protein
VKEQLISYLPYFSIFSRLSWSARDHQHVIIDLRTLRDGATKPVLLKRLIPRLPGRQLKSWMLRMRDSRD